MKILAVSDIHGNRTRCRRLYEKFKSNKFDVVIIAGDLTQFQGIDVATEIVSIITRLGKKGFFIPGNCDPPQLLHVDTLVGSMNIHGKKIEIKEFNLSIEIIGFGGSLLTPFTTWIEFPEEEFEKKLPIPEKKFILVSHNPPYNTKIDKIWRGSHVGSRILREYIIKYQPLVTVSGHIHESRGIDNIGGTVIVNPGPLQNGFYAIITIDSNYDVDIQLDKI